MEYKQKYFKYKAKYLSLKQSGGDPTEQKDKNGEIIKDVNGKPLWNCDGHTDCIKYMLDCNDLYRNPGKWLMGNAFYLNPEAANDQPECDERAKAKKEKAKKEKEAINKKIEEAAKKQEEEETAIGSYKLYISNIIDEKERIINEKNNTDLDDHVIEMVKSFYKIIKYYDNPKTRSKYTLYKENCNKYLTYVNNIKRTKYNIKDNKLFINEKRILDDIFTI